MTQVPPETPKSATDDLAAKVRSWIEQLDPDVIRGWFSSDEDDMGGYAEERQLDMAQLQKVALGGLVVVALLTLLMMGGNDNSRSVSATRTVGPAGHQTLDPVEGQGRSDHPEGDRQVYARGGGGGGGGGKGGGGGRSSSSRSGYDPCDASFVEHVKANSGFGMFSGYHRKDDNCAMPQAR